MKNFDIIYDNKKIKIKKGQEDYPSSIELINKALYLYNKNSKKPINFDWDFLSSQLNQVHGQHDSMPFLITEIRRWVKKPKKSNPLVLMFAGTSGTGKTFTADIIASALKANGFIDLKLQMNEYSSPGDAWKLLGSATGHVGSGELPPIFLAREKSDKIVILFDEIEKANNVIFRSIMQLMEEGVLSTGSGVKYDFKNCILIFTTNLAMNKLLEQKLKFINDDILPSSIEYQDILKGVLKDNGLPNEISGRIDSLFVFNSLDKINVKKIAVQEIRKLSNLYDIKINNVNDIFLDSIANTCAGSNEGARPIKREVQRIFEELLQDFTGDKSLIYEINSNFEFKVSLQNQLDSISELFSTKTYEVISKNEPLTKSHKINLLISDSEDIKSIDEMSNSVGLLILDGGESEGTGFLVSSDGLLITCSRCVSGKKTIEFLLNNKSYNNIDTLYNNEELDLAILKINEVNNLPFLKINNSFKTLKIGTKIGLLGFPKSREMGVNISYSEGIISKKEGVFYFHNANANYGSFGGPFFDYETRIVFGVSTGGNDDKGGDFNTAVNLIELYKQNDIGIEFIN